jgi:hypothetical protein
MNAAVWAGAALAVAGASPKHYRSHWRLGAKLLASRLKFQAKRTGFVSLGFHDWDILAAAYLARSQSKILDVYAENPKLSAEQIGVPRARFFERALVTILSGDELVVTEAEDEVLSRDSAHVYWVPMFTAIRDDDTTEFRLALIDYLREVHARSDDARREGSDAKRPYPGPLSVIGCALAAVMGRAPKLPSDVEHFVLRPIVKSALWRRS